LLHSEILEKILLPQSIYSPLPLSYQSMHKTKKEVLKK
jgi:hypothetical protein